MACPHFDLKIVGRAQQSRSVVASAAYQSGEQLYCEFQEKTKRYPKRVERIRYAEIMLPENAPKEYMDRGKLWNSVEMNEHQCNAQYARRFVMALPCELSEEENMRVNLRTWTNMAVPMKSLKKYGSENSTGRWMKILKSAASTVNTQSMLVYSAA